MADRAETTALAQKLKEHAATACEVEQVMRDVYTLLSAIDQGGLMESLPTEPHEHERFFVSAALIDIARRRLKALEDSSGTDLSIYLSIMADKAANAVQHG